MRVMREISTAPESASNTQQAAALLTSLTQQALLLPGWKGGLVKTDLLKSHAIQHSMGLLLLLFCMASLAGCYTERSQRPRLPAYIDRQRTARLDFKQGPIFALTKDKRLHVFSDGLMGKQDQPFLLTDIQSVTYERAFHVNQLSFQMKPDSGYRSMQFALSTPLSSVDEQLKMLEKMLGSVLPHLKIQRHVSVESALEPLKFTGAFVLLIFIGYVIGGGGYFMSFLCLIALFLDGLYLRTDNEIVSLAFSSMMQTQAGVISSMILPLILTMLVAIWLYAQKQQETVPNLTDEQKTKRTR